MNKIFPRQIFTLTFLLVLLIYSLTGLTLFNLLIYGLFIFLFGLLALVYLILSRRNIFLSDRIVYGHYIVTVLGCLPTFFVLSIMFSLISRTYDTTAIALQESLFKLYKVCIIAGPTLIILGQLLFIIGIMRSMKNKT